MFFPFLKQVYLNVGGRYSGGNTGGSGKPDIAISMRCIAKINSSAVSFPSWSMSDKLLREGKKTKKFIFVVFVVIACL